MGRETEREREKERDEGKREAKRNENFSELGKSTREIQSPPLARYSALDGIPARCL